MPASLASDGVAPLQASTRVFSSPEWFEFNAGNSSDAVSGLISPESTASESAFDFDNPAPNLAAFLAAPTEVFPVAATQAAMSR